LIADCGLALTRRFDNLRFAVHARILEANSAIRNPQSAIENAG